MANELILSYGVAGKNIYALIRNSVGQIWNTATPGFENYNAANYVADYTVALTEQGASGCYAGNMVAAAAGVYQIEYRIRAGSGPVEAPATDYLAGSGEIQWSGTAVLSTQSASDAAITANATVTEINADVDELITSVAAIPTSNPTTAQIATAVWQDSTAGDFTAAGSIGKTLGGSLGTSVFTTGKVAEVTLVDTLTTYTGNTPQTGDSFARIGATGSGLTSLAPSATALSTANWTNARAGYLDNINVGGPVANEAELVTVYNAVLAIPTNPFTGTTAQIATAVWQDSTAGDFTTAGSIGKSLGGSLGTSLFTAGKVNEVTLVDTLTTYTGNTPQTGDSFARIGATGSGLTSLAPAATALSTANWTNTRAGYLDVLHSFGFSVAGFVDVNVQYVNTHHVTGDGHAGTEWGPG